MEQGIDVIAHIHRILPESLVFPCDLRAEMGGVDDDVIYDIYQSSLASEAIAPGHGKRC